MTAGLYLALRACATKAVADEATNRAAFETQALYCDANAAPITARLCRALAQALDRTTETGRQILDWPGAPVADALVLRVAGGLHALWRAGQAPALDATFAGRETDPDRIAAALAIVLVAHDAALLPWLDGPPQTNEPGRSAGLMAGMLAVTARFGLPLDVLEIGSSAGLNLLIDRYRFDLGGVAVGPTDAPVLIRPEWRGPPPPEAEVRFAGVRGVDIQPVDATDPEAARRLLAYIWADHALRFDRVAKAIDMIRSSAVALERGDAADWVEARLAEPRRPGTVRVLMHSIVWQYLSADGQARITAAMARAGAEATEDRPLAWVRLEADRTLNRHDLSVRLWPGDGTETLAHAHAHGFWVEWVG